MNATTERFERLAAHARDVLAAPDSDAVETRKLARALWRRRWQIAGATLAAGVAIYIAMKMVEPTYAAYSKLMLDVRKAQIVSGDEVVQDVDPTKQIVNSEISVLSSVLVIDEMLSRLEPGQLDQLDPALQPRSVLSRVKEALQGLLSGAAEPLDDAAAAAERRARIVNQVRDMRRIYAERDSYVMVIRAEAKDPVLARDVVNHMADAYIALQLEARRAAVGRATSWLEVRLDELRDEVEGAERAVMDFSADSLLIDGATLENVSQQLAKLNVELVAKSAARLEAEARLNQMRSVLAGQGIEAAAAIVDTPVMEALTAQMVELKQNDAEWARSFAPNHPKRVTIQTKLTEVLAVMQAEVENAIAVLQSEFDVAESQELGLKDGISRLEEKAVQMANNQLGLRQLTREADAARTTYEALLVRVSEARAQRELQQPDAVLVEPALLPRSPSKPRPMLMATLGMTICAAMLSVWVLLNEMTPTTFRSARELEAATGLPVLAALPKNDWRGTATGLASLRSNANSPYAERIRQLRTALTIRRDGEKRGHSVMILSSAPGEGKTTTALALAEMATLSGRTAIIVDCDLRRPAVYKAVGGSGRSGKDFVDFIDGKCTLPDAIHLPKGFEFDVLAAKRPSQKAADQLSTNWLRPVLRELERAYDFVVVDAPAILALPDALILAREVNTRFYLVDFDKTPRAAVQRGLAVLEELGIGVRGMILNRVDPRRAADFVEEGHGYEY